MSEGLARFLLARLDEDEATARAAISGQADPENGWGYIQDGASRGALTPHVGIIHEPVQAAHVIRWHPDAVLADIEAKRRMVEQAKRWAEYIDATRESDAPHLRFDAVLVSLIGPLALPYAQHENYRGDWRP